MKHYNLDTTFMFGRYKGFTLRQVLDIQRSYIDWCLINIDDFYICKQVIDKIKYLKPGYSLSLEAEQKQNEKYINLENEEEDHPENENLNDNEENDIVEQTDWTHYNDDLDMDHQDINFWNQF